MSQDRHEIQGFEWDAISATVVLPAIAKFDPDQPRDEIGRWAAEGANTLPKDKPVVMVFGGSFNPPTTGHLSAVEGAAAYIREQGYDLTNIVMVPTPDRLITAKLGEKAYPLDERVALTQATVEGSHLPIHVTGAPSHEAEKISGKLRRTDLADWAKRNYPGHSVVAVTGEDAAPGARPPKGPAIYEGDKGSKHEGYHYLVMPRPDTPGAISSGGVRAALREGRAPPKGWMAPKAEAMLSGVFERHPEIVKYSPDQPRDDHGMWTSEGGGSGGDQAKPSGHAIYSSETEALYHSAEVQSRLMEAERLAHDLPETYHDMSPERQAMRARLAEEAYNKGIEDRVRGKEVTFVLGYSGSGKSLLMNPLLEAGALELNSDPIKERIPEYRNGIGANAVHEESGAIMRAVYYEGRRNGDNLAYERINSPARLMEDVKELKALGYKVHVKLLDVPIGTAIESAMARFVTKGRYVPQSVIRAQEGKPRASYEAVKASGLADSLEVWHRKEKGFGIVRGD